MASFEVIWQQLHRGKQFKKALFDARKDKFKSQNDEELFGIDIDSIFPSESHISNFCESAGQNWSAGQKLKYIYTCPFEEGWQ